MMRTFTVILFLVLGFPLCAREHPDPGPKNDAPPAGVTFSNCYIAPELVKSLNAQGWKYFEGGLAVKDKGYVCTKSLTLRSDKAIGILSFKADLGKGGIQIGCGYDESRVQPDLNIRNSTTGQLEAIGTSKYYGISAVWKRWDIYAPKTYKQQFSAVMAAGQLFKKDDLIHTFTLIYTGTDVEYYIDEKRVRAEHGNTSPGSFYMELYEGVEISDFKLVLK